MIGVTPTKSGLPGWLRDHLTPECPRGKLVLAVHPGKVWAGGNDAVRPGMVSVIQTARSDLGFSPHIHALASRGGWTPDGRWVPLPFVDPDAAEKIFRHKVILTLKDEGLLSEERAELLLSWRRSGFSVHNSVTASAADQGGLERLARYLMRPPLSLGRLHLEDNAQSATYRVKRSARVLPTA